MPVHTPKERSKKNITRSKSGKIVKVKNVKVIKKKPKK